MFENRSKNIIYLSIFLIPFLLFFWRTEPFQAFKLKVTALTSYPARILSSPFLELKKILYYHRTFNEYKRLKKEEDTLKARLVGLEEVVQENARLEKLLEFKRQLVYSTVTASVIGRNPSFWNSSLIIDRGRSDGVGIGMPVVNALGVIGKIAEVNGHSSKVLLLTDPQFSVAALVQRTRETGIVSGTLEGICRMRYVQGNAQVQVGDSVITSKLSSSFPEGLIIGDIIRVVEDPRTGSVECIIQPAVSFSQLEEVLVITQ